MNKLFAKSKKSKDKQKKKEELSQENDFLYGRSKRTGIGIAADTQSTRNDSISRGSEREFSASLNSTEKTSTSMSTSYYRGESFEAVRARNEYDNMLIYLTLDTTVIPIFFYVIQRLHIPLFKKNLKLYSFMCPILV